MAGQDFPGQVSDPALVREGQLPAQFAMGTHATSTASWSGSFSMVSSPPVARAGKWCTVLWTRCPLTVNQ